MNYNYYMLHVKNSRRGQSGLEYLGMAVLVMLGILVAGPYVVRSINSFFKAMEEGNISSHRENIQQASLISGVELPECSCGDLVPTGCGDGTTCSITQTVYTRACNPLGCDQELQKSNINLVMTECRDDAYNPANAFNCCEQRVNTGKCGVLAIEAPGGKCSDGEVMYSQVCGTPPIVTYSCEADVNCVFSCNLNGAIDANATACPDTTSELTSSAAWSYLASGSSCTSSNKCEAVCNPSYYPIGGGCLNPCGDGICQNGQNGTPDYGERMNGYCSSDCPPPLNYTGSGCASCPFGTEVLPNLSNPAVSATACSLTDTATGNVFYGSTYWNYITQPGWQFYSPYIQSSYFQFQWLSYGPFGVAPVAFIQGAICHAYSDLSWKLEATPISQSCGSEGWPGSGFYRCTGW